MHMSITNISVLNDLKSTCFQWSKIKKFFEITNWEAIRGLVVGAPPRGLGGGGASCQTSQPRRKSGAVGSSGGAVFLRSAKHVFH
jgi:hypothetical protein